jgi:hypothetical protein
MKSDLLFGIPLVGIVCSDYFSLSVSVSLSHSLSLPPYSCAINFFSHLSGKDFKILMLGNIFLSSVVCSSYFLSLTIFNRIIS